MNATRVEPAATKDSGSQKLRDIKNNPKKKLVLDVAGGAIFGALSIVLGIFTTPLIPRVPGWFIAYFDPISLIWIASFMIFGFRAGMLTTIVGAFGLVPFDPTSFIGALMKFMATVWFVLLPYLTARIKLKRAPVGEEVLETRNYLLGSMFAWLIRIGVMTILNYIMLTTLFPIFDTMNLAWMGLPQVGGWGALIVSMVILNTIQSIADALIPFVIVVKGNIYQSTKIW